MASNKIKLGYYVVGETVGIGSFGKVKMAEHEPTGLKVAMKILNKKKIANMDMIQKVRREIQYLKVLKHPHVIRLYEVINTPTDIFLIMEYVSGGELFDYIIKKGKLTEDEARRFFQQIVSAVEYCHRHNIVHRDLKPENLLLDSRLNVRIADFGLSNFMSDGELLKTSCGSPNYAAPEVISGKLYAGPEVDIWSCGVILYALLCGRLPFDDEFIPNLFHKIKSGVYSIPSYVSDDAKELIQAMLVVDPLKRVTIQEIQQYRWFSVNMPDYLVQLFDQNEPDVEVLNSFVVDEVARRLQLDQRIIRSALADEADNIVKVSYNLVHDYLRQTMDKFPVESSLQFSLSGSWDSKEEKMDGLMPEISGTSSSISILSSSLKSGLGSRDSSLLSSDIKAVKKRSKWHLGIRSSSRPDDVMAEVFRALKNLSMDWKIYDRYHICCRASYDDGRTVKVNLQLYKIDQKSYLLDFKNVPENGELACFDFFDVCFRLITELAIAT